jgi:hypothetical protein
VIAREAGSYSGLFQPRATTLKKAL